MKANRNGFDGEVLHFGAVRLRCTGSGTLRTTLYSLDEVRSSTLPTIALALTNRIEPTILANFEEQRASLKIETTAINEVFTISKLIIYVIPVLAEYPV